MTERAGASMSGDPRVPQYVYAPSRAEAQRVLDASYLKKYRAVPVRWWQWWWRAGRA